MKGFDILKKYFFRFILLFSISQLAIILLSLLSYKDISLLSYINISFYIGSLFIFIGLLFLTVKSGFFDGITTSFRRVIRGREISKKEVEEMALPSEMIGFNVNPLLWNGIVVIIIMLLALSNY